MNRFPDCSRSGGGGDTSLRERQVDGRQCDNESGGQKATSDVRVLRLPMREKGTVGLSRARCTRDENNEEPGVQHRPRSSSRMETLAAIVTIASSGCLERTGWRPGSSQFVHDKCSAWGSFSLRGTSETPIVITVVRRESLPWNDIAHEFVADEHDVSITFLLMDAARRKGAALHKHLYDEVIVILEGKATLDDGTETTWRWSRRQVRDTRRPAARVHEHGQVTLEALVRPLFRHLRSPVDRDRLGCRPSQSPDRICRV